MKNKIAIASAFLAASSFSMGEIVVNEFLSFEGFVDSSYTHTSVEAEGIGESDNTFGVDQVEIDWLFSFGNVSARVDLQYEEEDATSEVEQAFVNYGLTNGDVVTAGRYQTMLGFEAVEPTGLYQFSTAYDVAGFDVTDEASSYVQGVKYSRTTDTSFFGISIQDQAFGADNGRLGGDRGEILNNAGNPNAAAGESNYGLEVATSRDLGNGFSVFAGVAFDKAEIGDNQLVNTYVTYETGAWLFAAELNLGESERIGGNDIELTAGLLMANYAYSDVASWTARVSQIKLEQGANKADVVKYTVAHNYALSDNLLLVTEINHANGDLDITEDDVANSFDGDATQVAVELLFTF